MNLEELKMIRNTTTLSRHFREIILERQWKN